MKWLWAYIRRKVEESIHAGVYDAFFSEDGGANLTNEQAANALRVLLGDSDATKELENSAEAPMLAATKENGTPPQSDQPRRGPGRPRKFQEPPA